MFFFYSILRALADYLQLSITTVDELFAASWVASPPHATIIKIDINRDLQRDICDVKIKGYLPSLMGIYNFDNNGFMCKKLPIGKGVRVTLEQVKKVLPQERVIF
jgi:hypothetical protein